MLSSRSERVAALNSAGFLQGSVGALLVDRFETPRGHADPHKFFQLRYPNAMLTQIRRENAWHTFRNMPPNAAFFLGHAPAVNNTATRGP